MKASEAPMLEMLRVARQFEIPLYQRTYSWTIEECQTLWRDIVRAGSNDNVNVHFIGSVVHISKGQSNLTAQEPLLVIDGQQRLTSTTLLLKALASTIAERLDGVQEPLDGFSATKIAKRYLINDDEEDVRRYRLVLTQTDRDTLMAIVDDSPSPHEPSLRIAENFEWFRKQLFDFVDTGQDLAIVCRGLMKLMVVDIALTRDQENPQLIFESMNSTGKELSQADLIRNFVLMGLKPSLQAMLYKTYWRPMELAFGQAAYADHFDPFVRHFLTIKTGSIPRNDAIYDAFKSYYNEQLNFPEPPEEAALEALMADFRTAAEHYCALALGAEPDKALHTVFRDIAELKVDVAYPTLLELYGDYASGRLSKMDFLTAARLVEAYVFRRAVCGLATNSLNKTFSTLMKGLDKSAYLENFIARLVLLKSYKRFPDDEEFASKLATNDSYHFKRRLYLLRKLENFARKEPISITDYTIEHVLPQNPNLSEEWRSDLGDSWKEVQTAWLHTLGNLTLTGYNSEYSDKSFHEKKTMKGGFDSSPLKLNASVRVHQIWNEAAIGQRASELTTLATSVWLRPQVASRFLVNESKPKPVSLMAQLYPDFAESVWRVAHHALREEVLALDPTITEEIGNQVISFSSTRPFADVYIANDRLVVQAKVPAGTLDDPHGICTDISTIVHPGVGNLRMYLENASDLPKIMGVIRQAFDEQLDDSSEASAEFDSLEVDADVLRASLDPALLVPTPSAQAAGDEPPSLFDE
ncbi:hypothetical protein C3B78_04950 [Arthrobacter sp. PGP41]|uniref:DUF262 and DUF1524 domain-containing protein n=1 Tax=Arthrobacter sp. PGP41 TaxID=2079227 RepID=UPI000CDCD137|nr:DUF262 and DUF1524 domain-containing protein [Arthrobacter sp. PGP41]AUZ33874.1 hypothetical protein C3B78_04950 [Arthrobacter sp. PGP41]